MNNLETVRNLMDAAISVSGLQDPTVSISQREKDGRTVSVLRLDSAGLDNGDQYSTSQINITVVGQSGTVRGATLSLVERASEEFSLTHANLGQRDEDTYTPLFCASDDDAALVIAQSVVEEATEIFS